MEYITAPTLDKWQHYKKRNPPWIKLHRDIFNDYKYSCLQDASKLHLIMIWLLASQMDNMVPNDPEWIRKKINASENVDVESLVNMGFLEICYQDASKVIAISQQSAIVETETETEAEADSIQVKEDFIGITT